MTDLSVGSFPPSSRSSSERSVIQPSRVEGRTPLVAADFGHYLSASIDADRAIAANAWRYDHGRCEADLAVRGDPEKTQLVLLNFLVNAVKFTDAGGQVSLTCAKAAIASAVVLSGAKDLHVRVLRCAQDDSRGAPCRTTSRCQDPRQSPSRESLNDR